jgi:hypothetical protein
MTMTSPSPLALYAGQVPIGQLRDWGPGKVEAFHFSEGRRISLGYYRDRRAAREAIEARHAGPEPPTAA